MGITDPGTKLLELGIERHFRHVLTNYPDIGGRYSALSLFGMVPAALAGLDVEALLGRARRMAHACMGMVPAHENPGVRLGTALGTLANAGRDKVTFLMPGVLSTLGMWLEQLIAESTGKEGKGILPVALEPVGEPARLRRRPGLRALHPRRPRRRRPRRPRRRGGQGRPPPGAHPPRGEARRGPGVHALGARHRHRRVDPGHQRLQPAQRPGEQGQHRTASSRRCASPAWSRAQAHPHRGAPGRSTGHRRPERRGAAEGAPRRRRPRPLRGHHGLPHRGGGHRRRVGADAPAPDDRHPRHHHARLRAPLPPLHRPAPQGRAQHRPLPPAHRRRPRGPGGLRRGLLLRQAAPGPGPG